MTSLLLLLLSSAAAELEVQAERLDGARVRGALVSADSDGLTLRTATGEVDQPHKELLYVKVTPESEPVVHSRAMRVQLTGGTQLYLADFLVSGSRATATTEDGRQIRIPTRALRTVRLQPRNESLQEAWKQIAAARGSDDILVIRKTAGDEAGGGPVETVLDQLPGVVGDITEAGIGFEFQGSAVNVPRDKAEGIVFHTTAARLAATLCEVQERNGTVWRARSLTVKGDECVVTTISGVRGKIPFSQVIALDYSLGNLTYLTDIEPEATEFKPRVASSAAADLVAAWFQPRTAEGPLMIGGQTFDQALRVHSRTTLTYRLREDHQQLLATIGIDERFRDLGAVQLRISGDGKVLFEQEIAGRDAPQELAVDIRGVRRLTLLVDYGTDGDDRGDHLLLCNARLTK